jgi:hypothetical protein
MPLEVVWFQKVKMLISVKSILFLYITYLLSYCMEQSPSWEANQFSGSQEIAHILWKPKVLYRIHKWLPSVPELCFFMYISYLRSYISVCQL